MKISIACALFAAASALSEIPTYTSTIVSSSCPSIVSRAYYGNYSSSDADSYVYETDYATDQNTLTMLRTVCTNDDCYVTTILNKLTTVVTTVDGILTTYVTASPYTVVFNDETTSTVASPASPSSSSVANIAATATDSDYHVSQTGTTETYTSLTSASSTGDSKISEAPSSLNLVPTSTDLDSTIEEYVTSPHTTVITVTTCVDHNCYATSITTGVTVVTTTVDGVKTEYTTYCPLSADKTSSTTLTSTGETNVHSALTSVEASKTIAAGDLSSSISSVDTVGSTGVHTTIITVTSCSQSKCVNIPVSTGVSYITSTISGMETVYTTFCPLSTEVSVAKTYTSASSTKSAPVVPAASTIEHSVAASSRSVSVASAGTTSVSVTSAGTASTINVITNNIVTLSKATSGVSNGTSSIPSAIVSSYEGGATRAFPYFFSLPLLFLLI